MTAGTPAHLIQKAIQGVAQRQELAGHDVKHHKPSAARRIQRLQPLPARCGTMLNVYGSCVTAARPPITVSC